MTSIGKNAFNGCAGLKTITVKTEKLTNKNVGAGAFKGINKKATFKCPSNASQTYDWQHAKGKIAAAQM